MVVSEQGEESRRLEEPVRGDADKRDAHFSARKGGEILPRAAHHFHETENAQPSQPS